MASFPPLFQRSLFLLTSLSPFKFPSRIAFFQASHFEKTTFSQENSIPSFFPSQITSLTPSFTTLILLQVWLTHQNLEENREKTVSFPGEISSRCLSLKMIHSCKWKPRVVHFFMNFR
uniref:Uncharacterized protein n=1 Tax=Cucumis sativus TaxID=3659 RepID=A0A0A0L686_CUCSA